MMTITQEPTVTETEYLALEVGYLTRRIKEGDAQAIKTSLATIAQITHQMRMTFDPQKDACARLAMSQGYYRHWPFLDE